MINLVKTAISWLAFSAAMIGLAGCEQRDDTAGTPGPAETAGEKLDQATVRAGEQLNKLAEQAGKGLQEMGNKLQEKAQEAQSTENSGSSQQDQPVQEQQKEGSR